MFLLRLFRPPVWKMSNFKVRDPVIQERLDHDYAHHPLVARMNTLDQGNMSQAEYLVQKRHYLVFLIAHHYYEAYLRRMGGIQRRDHLQTLRDQKPRERADRVSAASAYDAGTFTVPSRPGPASGTTPGGQDSLGVSGSSITTLSSGPHSLSPASDILTTLSSTTETAAPAVADARKPPSGKKK